MERVYNLYEQSSFKSVRLLWERSQANRWQCSSEQISAQSTSELSIGSCSQKAGDHMIKSSGWNSLCFEICLNIARWQAKPAWFVES